jgi:pimeloyl-ACP methyl ester carboxylesterase
MFRSGQRFAASALLAALLAGGCEGDLASEPPVGPAPAFVPGSCAAMPPPGLSVACGTVRVPERRGQPASPEVAIQVALIQGRGASPAAPLAAYLAGPAGGSGVGSAFYYAGWSLDGSLRAFLAKRTLVAIDLRGTGGSTPSLRCPGARVAALPGTADRIDPDTEAALRECRMRLSDERVAPAAYGTEAAAEDVEAVRRALGGSRWDLLGSGYGARVALEVVRRHPGGLRAVVLDSVLPPEVDLLAEEGPAAARALAAMADRCAGDEACRAAHPDPLGVLAALVERLDADPIDVGTHGGSVFLSGGSLARAVLQQLQEPGGAAQLPRRLYEAEAGSYDYFAAVLGAPRGEGSVGAHLSVMCGEALPASSRDAIEAKAAALPDPVRRALTSRFYPLVCPLWSVPEAPAALREPVRGALPVLLLAGSHDPISPPAWAQQVARGLTGARTIELPDQGHGLLRSPCPAGIAAAFLEDPATSPASTCAPAVALRPAARLR